MRMNKRTSHNSNVVKLKQAFLVGIAAVFIFLAVLTFLSWTTIASTTAAQLILIIMGATMAIGYMHIALFSPNAATVPTLYMSMLNVLVSLLIWSTGLLQSPFIILYVILIILSVESFSYRYGLLQSVIALAGFTFLYGATIERIIPYQSLLAISSIDILIQPVSVTMVYVSLYTLLLLFSIFVASKANIIYLHQSKKDELNMTYQEKIIAEMPIGVVVVDGSLNILGMNPAGQEQFPIKKTGDPLTRYLSLGSQASKTLKQLSKNNQTKVFNWETHTGAVSPVMISVRTVGDSQAGDYIVFLLEP